jgi:hypothetical protein
VKVRYNEGVAIHIGPEPCIVGREVRDEASAGERTGQPLSRESWIFPGADAVRRVEGNTDGRVSASARRDLAWSKTLACADAPCTGTGRSHVRPMANAPKVRIGKVRNRSR